MKIDRNRSRDRFRNGSLTMDAGIECTLNDDNYLSIKKRKQRTGLENK